MFALVAVMCLYLGINNIRKAFAADFSRWRAINYLLLISGVVLVLVGIACIFQAVKDHKEAGEKEKEKEEKEKQLSREQFFYDEEEAEKSAESNIVTGNAENEEYNSESVQHDEKEQSEL